MDENRIIGTDDYTLIGDNTVCGYDKSNFSKWSDCTFETPFVPTIGRESNANAIQSQNAQQKIRKNMFENSYFSDFKSLQGTMPISTGSSLSGSNCAVDTAPARNHFGQIETNGK